MTLPYARALVTGATGFVGSNLCRTLTAHGVQVYATGLDTAGLNTIGEQNQTTVRAGDITDPSFVDDLLEQSQPEAVFHLAAYGTFGHEQDVPRMIDVNINGTRHLLAASAAAGCRSFVQAGSIKEYVTGRTPITEEQPLRPWDTYAATKAAASFFCRLAGTTARQTITTLRLSPTYGPGDTVSRFVPSAIAAALAGTPFKVSVGALVRNFTYIDDVVAAFLLAGQRQQHSYEEYNLGGPAAHSFSDILTAVETATGRSITQVVAAPASPADDSWVVDSAKAQRGLGWQAQVPLAEGIARTVKWYQSQVTRHT